MNTTPVAHTASALSSSAGRNAASRKAETADNPFQQMLSEEITSKAPNSGKASERASATAASNKKIPPASDTPVESSVGKAADETAAHAANAADKSQGKSDEVRNKEERSEPNGLALSPELAAMVNGLLQRQAAEANAAAGKGEESEADISRLLGKDLADLARAKHGDATELDLQAKLQGDNATDAELDMLAATTSQAVVDGAGEEVRPAGFSPMLQQMNRTGASATARAGSAAPYAELAPPVGSQGWNQALGQRVVWMASGAEHSASLTLNPPELGPLQVVLNVSNNHANATFVAPHAEVRQALEAAMPKLREMLGEAGIQLDQASVNQSAPQQQGEFARSDGGSGSRGQGRNKNGSEQITSEPAVSHHVTAAGNGLVDTFA